MRLRSPIIKKTGITSSDKYIKFKFKDKNSPECIMTLRTAGGMGRNSEEETENRKIFLSELGIKKYYKLNQVHSRDVYNTEELTDGIIKNGDGLLTFSKKDVLAVTIADCMPVFFYSKSSEAFGVLHSGWKGTGISIEAVNYIEKHTGRSVNDFEFILGPSIGPCCYEVDRERASVFENLYGKDTVVCRDKMSCKLRDKEKVKKLAEVNNICPGNNKIRDINNSDLIKRNFDKTVNTGYYLDLRKANINILEKKGVKSIKVIENCTCCGENFYSFRGDGAKQFNLMLALIGYFI